MDHTMTKNPDSIPYNIWPAEALRLAEREAADSLGLTLFVVTLLLNIVAMRIVQAYREQYD